MEKILKYDIYELRMCTYLHTCHYSTDFFIHIPPMYKSFSRFANMQNLSGLLYYTVSQEK